MPAFKDHFSERADAYARSRPGYPAALFDWLARIAPARDVVWDCGTGNGQAARGLTGRFRHIVATDPSLPQLRNAFPHPRISYAAATADHCCLAERSADLVTAAQALHWFDIPGFWAEARRVLRPGGIVAVWTYNFFRVSPEFDAVLERFLAEVRPYWPPERAIVDDAYGSVPFPFDELAPPPLEMSARWTATHALEYLRTWSGVQRYRRARGRDPVAEFAAEMREAWGRSRRTTHWPLTLRAGRV